MALSSFHLLSLQSDTGLFCPGEEAKQSHMLPLNSGSRCIIYAHNEQLLTYSIS